VPLSFGLKLRCDAYDLLVDNRDHGFKGESRIMMKFLSPDSRGEWRLAVCLALIAGYVDAYGIRVFGAYVSFMSGNTTQTGSLSGQAKFAAALPSAVAIVFFVAGAFVGTWLTHSALRHSRRLLLGAVAVSLAAIIGLTQLDSLDAEVVIATLAFAMGMMNTAQSKVGTESVSLTFVTGDLHRMGSHLALAVKRAPLPDAYGSGDTHLRRAYLLASVWAGFLIGAMLAGAASLYFGVWVLLPPALILLALSLIGSA